MKDEQKAATPKFGAGTGQAWLRQGLHEIRNALYPGSNVAAPTETGMYGTALPSEVAADKQRDLRPGETPNASIIESRIRSADRLAHLPLHEHEREPGPERE